MRSMDKRSNSRWLWGAVEVGAAGGEKKSHKKGNKRIALTLLPRKGEAIKGKPRGKGSRVSELPSADDSGNLGSDLEDYDTGTDLNDRTASEICPQYRDANG